MREKFMFNSAQGVALGVAAVRVLVVDDYEPWCRFVSTTLRKEPELQIVGQVSDGLEAVQQAKKLQPDLILLDIGLPRLNGIECARRMREVAPGSKIIFLSETRSTDVAEEALRTGASGYVVKSDAGSELLPAVEAVLQGKCFLSIGVAGGCLSPRCTQDTSDKVEKTSDYSAVWDADLGLFRVDMDEPMAVDLPEEEQIQRILRGSYIADANDEQARMYGLESAKDLVGRRMSDMVMPDDCKNIELTRLFIRSGYRLLHRKSYEVDVRGNPKVFLNSMTGVVVEGKLIATLGRQADITKQEAWKTG